MKRALIAILLTACSEAAPSRAPLGETENAGQTELVLPPAQNERALLLPAASRDALDRARLPLLLPRDPAFLRSAIVTQGPHFSALSAQHDGITLAIAGTDARFELAEEIAPPEPTDQVRGQPAVFSVNDEIRTVAWDEATIAWAVDVECSDPANDARCASDDFLRSIVEGLELVGGGP